MRMGLAAAVMACVAGVGVARADDKPSRPNLVFLLADDLRWNTLGCMGDPIVQTPNIDRLAAAGTRFRNAFVTTSICCVSRASILSGQHVRRHGIEDFSTPFTPTAWAETYPALLRKQGYRTGFIGKFGVGNARDIAAMEKHFDYWRGLPGQAGPFFDKGDPRHKTARFGDEALEFLAGCKAGEPFCLSLSFSAPHARDGQPREFPPDPRDEKLYADATMPVPPTATEAYFHRLPEFVRTSEGRKRWKRRFATPEEFQKTTRDYYRLVTGIDREVGRIREALAKHKFADNTVIAFTSDNGFCLGDRGMADKWLMYEESIRVPLIVCDPRVPERSRGRSPDEMVLNIDVAPTLLDLAGVAVPERMQGKSLMPFLRGKPDGWRTDFFYEHHFGPKIIPPSEGVRTTGWKYLRWVNRDPVLEELYDLEKDPQEEKNLAAVPEHRKRLESMRIRWQQLRQQVE